MKKIILFVDDDDSIRETVHDLLEMEGYLCSACSNGHEAWEMLERGLVPHLIFTDIMMPQMDGFELIERISLLPALKKVPIIAATASTTIKMRLPKNVIALAKPFDLEKLLSIVEEQTKEECYETQSRISTQSKLDA